MVYDIREGERYYYQPPRVSVRYAGKMCSAQSCEVLTYIGHSEENGTYLFLRLDKTSITFGSLAYIFPLHGDHYLPRYLKK